MATGNGHDDERFAAALDHGEFGVGGLDEELRRELEVVALLRRTRAELGPDAAASARMRARVMGAAQQMSSDAPQTSDVHAEAPTVEVDLSGTDTPAVTGTAVTETVAEAIPIDRARGRHRFPGRAPRGPEHVVPRAAEASGSGRRSLAVISAAAAVTALAVTGGGAMFSQNALPGDPLYGVKQTTESAILGLTMGQENRAQRHLDYAATRVDEIQAMHSDPSVPAGSTGTFGETLHGFDQQTLAGARLWMESAGAAKSSSEFGALSNWAETQAERLSEMRSSLPASSQDDVEESLRMLSQLQERAEALNSRTECDQLSSGESDRFGPVPAEGSCGVEEAVRGPSTRSSSPSSSADAESSQLPTSEADRSSIPPSSEESEQLEGPELPDLPGLPGGDGSSGGGLLPDRESTRGSSVPNSPEQTPQPLPLNVPLLPIG